MICYVPGTVSEFVPSFVPFSAITLVSETFPPDCSRLSLTSEGLVSGSISFTVRLDSDVALTSFWLRPISKSSSHSSQSEEKQGSQRLKYCRSNELGQESLKLCSKWSEQPLNRDESELRICSKL